MQANEPQDIVCHGGLTFNLGMLFPTEDIEDKEEN